MKDETYKRISDSFLLTLLKAIYLFIPGIIFLSLYYFIIVKIDIGQDMLMQAYENACPYFFSIISILIWMLFEWFSSRLISDQYIAQCQPPHEKIFQVLPRLLGYNVAVCLQIAILNLPVIHLQPWILWLIFAFHNAFFILLTSAFTADYKSPEQKKLLVISGFIAFIYIVVIIILFNLGVKAVTAKINVTVYRKNSALLLVILFFFFEVVFLAFVIWRRKLINKNRNEITFVQRSKTWRKSYNVFAILVAAFYILIVFLPTLADSVGAIGITLLAFGLWVGFICILKYITIKFNVHFWLPLLVLAIIYGAIYNPYTVRLPQSKTKLPFSNRDSIDAFFLKWVNNPVRKAAIDSGTDYKVYLVMSDGGASKSGFWVADVLSKLEDSSKINNQFSTHLFSLAGASGGSVGNAVFYSLLKANADHKLDNGKPINDSLESRKFFESDFLSSSFARFLGPDLFKHIIPFLFTDDRAAELEKAMEHNSNSKIISDYFSKSINAVFDTTGRLPALFINTTNLQSGSPGVISNIRLDSQITERLDILKLIDTVKIRHTKDSMHDIRLSTAVILGARFPYISPAGAIGSKYFVDGGYFDNSGAGITLELLQYIERKMYDSTNKLYPQYKNKLVFKVIYISNGSDKSKEHSLNPVINDAAAPLLTVLGTYGMQTNLANKKLNSFMNSTKLKKTGSPFEVINLPMKLSDTLVPYPMNWVISKYNLDRMNSNLQYVHPESILHR